METATQTMKTVTVSWSEKVYYITTMDVPENWDHKEIENSFWAMDLSDEKPVDADFAQVEDIEECE